MKDLECKCECRDVRYQTKSRSLQDLCTHLYSKNYFAFTMAWSAPNGCMLSCMLCAMKHCTTMFTPTLWNECHAHIIMIWNRLRLHKCLTVASRDMGLTSTLWNVIIDHIGRVVFHLHETNNHLGIPAAHSRVGSALLTSDERANGGWAGQRMGQPVDRWLGVEEDCFFTSLVNEYLL